MQLVEEGLKEKKEQKLLKAGFEARARARREKEKEKEEREEEERHEEEEHENDFRGWAGRLRRDQEVRQSTYLLCLMADGVELGRHEQDKGA